MKSARRTDGKGSVSLGDGRHGCDERMMIFRHDVVPNVAQPLQDPSMLHASTTKGQGSKGTGASACLCYCRRSSPAHRSNTP